MRQIFDCRHSIRLQNRVKYNIIQLWEKIKNTLKVFLKFSWRALNWGGNPIPVKQLTTTKPRFSPHFSLFSLSALTTLSSLSPSLAVFTSIHTLAYTFSLIISSSLKERTQHILSTSLTFVTLVALAFTLLVASLLFLSHGCNKK